LYSHDHTNQGKALAGFSEFTLIGSGENMSFTCLKNDHRKRNLSHFENHDRDRVFEIFNPCELIPATDRISRKYSVFWPLTKSYAVHPVS